MTPAGPLGLLAATGGETGRELVALGAALLIAGLLARAGRRIGLPTIPLFMAAGILTGPHTPGPVLIRDPADLGLLTTLGLILLLFHLGLEFSLDDLLAGGRRLLAAGAVYLAINMSAGVAIGASLGWGGREVLVIAGIVGISSSAIVTKLLVELRRLANPETGLLLGIIVVEDVFLAIYLAMLQPVLGGAEGAGEAVASVGKGVAFLVLLVALARWGRGPVGRLLGTGDDELLTVCFIGVAVLIAGVAANVGVSDAIGAFLAGQVVAGTSVAHRVQRLVLPLRDLFAAMFFFAFGLSVDPGALASVALPVLAAVTVTALGCVVAGVIAARIQGFGPSSAANIGLTVVARGEFSLILATLAVAAGLDGRLGPFTAGYVLVLAVAGPLAASRSHLLARRLPARLFPPPPLPRKVSP
ncbi:MAG TPA: cation:proton antiporter [Acidimicrobiales bacterium]|nr:cation:proton antiporter [Acidimicrobiales bacterium]